MERDESGNIRQSKNGKFRLDSQKEKDVVNYMNDPTKVKSASLEDLKRIRDQQNALQQIQKETSGIKLATTLMSGDNQGNENSAKAEFYGIDKNGNIDYTVRNESLKKIKRKI